MDLVHSTLHFAMHTAQRSVYYTYSQLKGTVTQKSFIIFMIKKKLRLKCRKHKILYVFQVYLRKIVKSVTFYSNYDVCCLNRTEHNRTEQNRTEQNRTEQNRTEQTFPLQVFKPKKTCLKPFFTRYFLLFLQKTSPLKKI
jgi:hypothetical protein